VAGETRTPVVEAAGGVGKAEQISAMERPTAMVKAPVTKQPRVMVAGPPKVRPAL
jgi:hypothetical protein